jgi:hypothetical protein
VKYYEWNNKGTLSGLGGSYLNSLNSYKSSKVGEINMDAGTGSILESGRGDKVAVLFKGRISFEHCSEDVQLCLKSDDGSMMKLNGQTVINNDGDHGDNTVCTGFNSMSGRKDIEVHFYENST